jgi:surface antigen
MIMRRRDRARIDDMHVGISDAFRVLPLALAVCLMVAQPATAQVNPFGDSLDLKESDVAMLQAAASALFEDDKAQVGQTKTWSNPETGNSGAVSLLQLFEHASMPCKRLQHTIRQKGHADQSTYRFARCRAADGTWKLF